MDVPLIDIAPLFGPAEPARDAVDRAILAAAADAGFMTLTGLPEKLAVTAEKRSALLRIFDLPDAEKRRLWRRRFDPAASNLYRGWFPLEPDSITHKEGIDIGPDIAHPGRPVDAADPLTEPTPLPDEASLPGWRAVAAGHYRAMETVGIAMLRAIARGLGLAETVFDAAMADGISTLRLIRYPPRPEGKAGDAEEGEGWAMHDGRRRQLIGIAHVDSGLVTLLAQDGVGGLQARGADGAWADVPPREGTLAVNFGKLLSRWTGGRVKATEHRILGSGTLRHSIPFFFEPRVDARIAPLPLGGVDPFAPFHYGDHVWAEMVNFVEFRGLEGCRTPRGARPA